MDNVIGFKDTTLARKQNWEAMLLFKKCADELSKTEATKAIALKEKERYNRFLSNYIKKAA